MTWDSWIKHHAAVFGLAGDERDVGMLHEWARLFKAAGFAAAEVAAATDWVALHDPPRFRDGQLLALQQRVRAERARRQGLAAPAAGRPGGEPACGDCQGTGFVSVPDPRAVARGRWATTAVLCTCRAGSYRRQGLAELNPPLLEVYESDHPAWRDQAEAHRRELAGWSRAQAAARCRDQEAGPLAFEAVIERARRAAGG